MTEKPGDAHDGTPPETRHLQSTAHDAKTAAAQASVSESARHGMDRVGRHGMDQSVGSAVRDLSAAKAAGPNSAEVARAHEFERLAGQVRAAERAANGPLGSSREASAIPGDPRTLTGPHLSDLASPGLPNLAAPDLFRLHQPNQVAESGREAREALALALDRLRAATVNNSITLKRPVDASDDWINKSLVGTTTNVIFRNGANPATYGTGKVIALRWTWLFEGVVVGHVWVELEDGRVEIIATDELRRGPGPAPA